MPATGAAVRPPRPRHRLALVLLVLAGAAVGTAAVLARVDAGFLKGRLEAAVLHATGRTLRIDGAVHFTLLPAPGITASDVALGNLPGGSRPDMVRAAYVAATFDPLALLGRRLAVRSVVVTRPDILLERVADGRPNWVFSPAASPRPAGGGADAGAGSSVGRFHLDISSLDV